MDKLQKLDHQKKIIKFARIYWVGYIILVNNNINNLEILLTEKFENS